MYKNRISRTSTNRKPKFFFRRSEIAFDERAAYVESVCATLIESRFGPGRVDPVVINFSDRPELEPALFDDMSDYGIVPCYALSPQQALRRRAGHQLVKAAFRMAKQMGLVVGASHGNSLPSAYSSNLGRGSP